MTESCFYCSNPINPFDEGVYKQVVGWVGGPKQDGMILREDTGRHACRTCIAKLKLGQATDQPALFDADASSGQDVGNVPIQGRETGDHLDDAGTEE